MQIKNNHIFLLVLACIMIFFIHLDALWLNVMEVRNFATAREMLHDNNWIMTTLNGDPRYQKPPLPTWITAIFGAIFSIHNIAALRLPAAITSLILIVCSYKLAMQFSKDKTYAFLSSLILGTSFYIVFSGRNGQWDIFTHGFMMVCIYQLYLFFTSEEKKYQHVLIAAFFFGCSFMSKGPVSLYTLLLPFLIAFGFTFKYRKLKSRLLPLALFLVLAFVLSAWWHYYTYLKDPQAVLAITSNETNNWTNYNIRPFYYYWSFFTQSGIWTIPAFIGLLYPYLKNKVFDKKAYQFTLIWLVASVLLLSIIPEKKSRYLLPVLIPLAMNTGFYIEYLFRNFSSLKNKKETFPVYFNFGLIALIGLSFSVVGYILLKDIYTGNWLWFIVLAIVLVVIGIGIVMNLRRKRIQPVFYLTILFICAVTTFGLPMVKFINVNPEYKSFSILKDWQSKNDVSIYEYSYFTPEVTWSFGEPIKVLRDGEKVLFPKENNFGILVEKESTAQFYDDYKGYAIKKISDYDINPIPPGNERYSRGLYRDFYIVTALASIPSK
jgi:4-amino-4-deoxy-L-arabinose transferase-like glycosyltransferase